MRRRVKDLAFAIKVPKNNLIQLALSIDAEEPSFYRNWEEPKTDKQGKPRFNNKGQALTRPINAPIARLKKVQRKILRNVFYKLNLPDYYFGGIQGKDAVLNARFHQGNKFFFLTDLKDFYPSINFRNVETALRKEGFYPDVARIITRLCTKGGVIPQGCPTSSFLASLVVHHTAGELFENYIKKGLKVSLYVDDITISSNEDFKEDIPNIINQLRTHGLIINFDKTEYKTKSPVVTGVQVLNNGIAPTKQTYDALNEDKRSKESVEGYLQRIKYIKKVARSRKR